MNKNLKSLFLVTGAILGLVACAPENTEGGVSSAVTTTSVQEGVAITKIEITCDNTSIYVGETTQFNVTLTPSNASLDDIEWSVNNATIGEVDATGLFTAKKAGSTVVKAKYKENTKIYGQISIQCKNYIRPTALTADKSTVSIGTTNGFYLPVVEFEPANVSSKELTYTLSGDDVVTVNNETGMVTAKEAAGSAVLRIASKDTPTVYTDVTINVTNSTWGNYEQVQNVNPYFTVQELMRTTSEDAIPVQECDDIELLVVPVEFTDYPFSQCVSGKTEDDIVHDIDVLFNGDGEKDTNYWESLSSYYKKSSFGKVNIHVTVGEIYRTGKKAAETTGIGTSVNLASEVLNNYRSAHDTDGKEFDNDGNGLVDAIYMIYSAKDYSKVSSLDNDLFWAYVHRTGNNPNLNRPAANNYMWASYDFMYEKGTNKVDAHTFIHETGHLMGADDYYNYNKTSSRTPLGGIDMMDMNIGDHNVWTKMEYGWTKPYNITGNTRITINPSSIAGDTIVLRNGWNKSAFDEMLLLELYTPEALNELDSKIAYTAGRPLCYDQFGVKLYHADGRLYNSSREYANPTTLNGSYYIPSSNSDFGERNSTPELFYELGLIQAGKKATMIKEGASGTNADLFHTGDVFTMEEYHEFFYQEKPKFNDGSSLGFEIYFEEVTATSATLVIQVA